MLQHCKFVGNIYEMVFCCSRHDSAAVPFVHYKEAWGPKKEEDVLAR